MRCHPSVTLISYDRTFGKFLGEIPLSGPIVKIVRESISLTPQMLVSELDTEQTKLGENVRIKVLMDAVHINRLKSNLKIIITNWDEDQDSVKPDLTDPDFPVKSMIFLMNTPKMESYGEPYLEKFPPWQRETVYNNWENPNESLDKRLHMQLLEQFRCFLMGSNINYSAERLSYDHSELSITNGSHEEWQYCYSLSIAFAGEDVHSDVYECTTDQIIGKKFLEDELENFKKNLKFETKDDRVFGFIFSDPHGLKNHPGNKNYFRGFDDLVMKKFTLVSFVRLPVGSVGDDVRFGIHLIRM